MLSAPLRSSGEKSIHLLKGGDLVVAGYASVEVVDKQGDKITKEALKDAFAKNRRKKSPQKFVRGLFVVLVLEVRLSSVSESPMLSMVITKKSANWNCMKSRFVSVASILKPLFAY